MVDIGVYTTEETLQEKKKFAKDPEFYVWWTLNPLPSRGDLEKVFFAADGEWKGFFTVEQINGNRIYLDEWHDLEEKAERTAFRGFTYDIPEVEQ